MRVKNKRRGARQKNLRYMIVMFFLTLYLLAITNFSETEVYLPQEKTPVVLYSNQTGDDLRRTVIEAILQAKESVRIMIYTLSDSEIMSALQKKRAEGVHVEVVYDTNATADLASRLGLLIKSLKWHDKGLMHNKLLVIDHKTVYFGSTNFTKDSFTNYANLIIGIDSPDLARTVEAKIQALFDSRAYKAKPTLIATKEQAIEFSLLPDDTNAEEKLISYLNTAKKSIKVAMYTFTNKPLTQALIDAHKRGVAVDVVIDRDSAKQTSRETFRKLKRLKVPVAISDRKGLLHHKLALIDDDILVTGSANWTKAAFHSNDENIAFIHPLTAEQKDKLKKLWEVIKEESKVGFLGS